MRWESVITSQINHFILASSSRCKKIKSLAILISDVKISHQRGLTSFGQQEHLLCINSPVPSSSNEMRICNYITNKSLHFVHHHWRLVSKSNPVKYVILPATRQNVSLFSWAVQIHNITEESLHLDTRRTFAGWRVMHIIS